MNLLSIRKYSSRSIGRITAIHFRWVVSSLSAFVSDLNQEPNGFLVFLACSALAYNRLVRCLHLCLICSVVQCAIALEWFVRSLFPAGFSLLSDLLQAIVQISLAGPSEVSVKRFHYTAKVGNETSETVSKSQERAQVFHITQL